jgi:hypothetical protein
MKKTFKIKEMSKDLENNYPRIAMLPLDVSKKNKVGISFRWKS